MDHIPIHLRVPGIAVTILQMSSDQSSMTYVNNLEENDQTDEGKEPSTDMVNFTRALMNLEIYRKPQRFTNNKSPHPPPQPNKTPFKGSCFGCVREGHHAEACYFLMKVK